MNEIELIYAELIFSLLKSKWVYNEQILIDDIKSKAKIDGTPNIQEMKHLISFMEEMNIVKRNVFGSKTHVYIAMEALKFSSFNQAKTHFDIINNKKSKMIDLEIKRAENDIWWGTWGKLVSIIGTFLGIILGAIANQYNWFGLF